MYQRSHIKEGMTVRSLDGHKLGTVYAVGDTEFHIEKGLFFPKDYSCRFSEISDIRDGDIILPHGRDSLHRLSMDAPAAFNATGLGAPQYTAPKLDRVEEEVDISTLRPQGNTPAPRMYTSASDDPLERS